MREFKGAFQIARQVFESDIFFYKPDKWFKIWVFIIGICNHKDNGKFKKGECLTTYREISEYTGATKAQIDMFIRWAKSTTQLTTRKTTRGMYINVIKYSYFQDMSNYKTTQKTIDETNCKRNGNDTIIKNDNNKNNNTNVAKATEEPPKVDYKKYENLYLSLLAEYRLPPAMISYGKFRANLPKVLEYLKGQNETIENYWRWYLDEFHFKEGGKDVFATEKYGTEPSTTLSSYFVSKFIKEK